MKRINYKTSRDYTHLKELLDAGYEVVCFITYDFNERHKGEKDYFELITTDVCYARFDSEGRFSRYSVNSRGQGYIDYWVHQDKKYTFEEICEAENLEYIEPNKEQFTK